VQVLIEQWGLRPDGDPIHGHCLLVLPVLTAEGAAAMLKIGFPEEESEHEHLVLQRWGGNGAVRLLSADPHHRGLLLERLHSTDFSTVSDAEACVVVADLCRRIHVPALPQLRPLSLYVDRWTADRTVTDRVIHTDLHYNNVLGGNVVGGNVLAAEREPWLVIDRKPVNGDPYYEIAPRLWNR